MGLPVGNDIAVIALWLGHENVTTPQIYQREQADMALKQRALDRTTPPQLRRASTSHPTSYWPSSKPSDYADTRARSPPLASTGPPGIDITAVSG